MPFKTPITSEKTKDILAILFLLLLVLVLFWRTILFGEAALPANSMVDSRGSIYPIKLAVAWAFRQGEIPLWNPYIFLGTPLLADVQSAAFYPLDVFFYLLPTPLGYSLVSLLIVFLASLFMYLYMRSTGVGRIGSLVAATVFSLSGYFLTTLEYHKYAAALLWFPLLLFLLERTLNKRSAVCFSLAGLVMGVIMLSGDHRLPLYMILSSALVLTLVCPTGRPGLASTAKALGLCGAVGAVGLAISAVVFVPFAELGPISSRQFLPARSGWVYFSPLSLPFNLLAPYLFGNEAKEVLMPTLPFIDVSGFPSGPKFYAGLLPLVLALIAIVRARAPHAQSFKVLALLTMVFLTLLATPLDTYIRKIPGSDTFAHENVLFIFITSLAVLAGHGAHLLVSGEARFDAFVNRLRRWVTVLWVAAAAVAVAVTLLIVLGQGLLTDMAHRFAERKAEGDPSLASYYLQKVDYYVDWFSRHLVVTSSAILGPLLFGLGTVLILWLAGSGRARPRMALAYGSVLLVASDLLFVGLLFFPSTPSRLLYPENSTTAYLKGQGGGAEFRAMPVYSYPAPVLPIARDSLNASGRLLTPDDVQYRFSLLIPSRIQSIRGYEGITLGAFVEFTSALLGRSPEGAGYGLAIPNPASPLVDLFNVRYIIADRELEAPRLVKLSGGKSNIYENTAALPRAFVVEEARIYSDRGALLQDLIRQDDPSSVVFLEEAPLSSAVLGSSPQPDAVKITSYSFNHVRMEADLAQPGFLVLTDAYYPGWKAYVDGEPSRIYRADYLVRAVYVSEGQHTVIFLYDPLSFKIGAAISLATLATIGGFGVFAAISSIRRRSTRARR